MNASLVSETKADYQVQGLNRSGIIGGMFALPTAGTVPLSHPHYDFLDRGALHLTNARSAILMLVKTLGCNRVWLPSYLCPSIVSALKHSEAQVLYYPVDAVLKPSDRSWLADVRERDLVLLIDYFGFPSEDEVSCEVQRRKAWVLEDASQALLTDRRLPADFILLSPRKFVGVPDGGILISRSGLTGFREHPLPPHSWWLTNLEAMVRRREFDHCAVSNDWFGWYQKAKKEAPAGEYRMSEVTWTLLNSSFDYERISKQRVHNYNFLADELGELALRPDLPDGVVPLGFPIRVSNREQVTRKLYDARIYPAVHWDVKGVVSGDFQPSLQLSGEIMTLPCDQRYTPSDLSGMVSIIQQHGLSR